MGTTTTRLATLVRRCATSAWCPLIWFGGRSSRSYAALLEQLPQGVMQLEVSGTIVHAGGAWRKLIGRSPEQLCGKTFLEYLYPKDRRSCQHFLERASTGSAPEAGLRLRLLATKGEPRWILLRAGPLGPTPSSRLVGTLDDIHERVQAEEMTRAYYRSLENLIGQLPGMLYRCRNDHHWTMEYVSVGSELLCGYRPADLIDNHRISYEDLVHPEDRAWVRSDRQASLRKSQEFELHYRLVSAEGRVRWVLERGRGIYAAGGTLLGVEGIILESRRSAQLGLESWRRVLYEGKSGLPTPALFLDRLHMAVQGACLQGPGFILMLLGVDHCQKLRRQLGKAYDTRLLPELGRRLSEVLGPLDSLCLLEDDGMYALLLLVHPGVSEAAAVARRLQEQAQAPLLAPETTTQVTISIGIVLGKDGQRDGESLLAAGRVALARAHSLGGARFELENPRSHALAALRGVTARELEAALQNGELRLHWQPVIELSGGTSHALEARMIWPHPHRGQLFAEQFVSDLEDSRQVTALWEWIFLEMQRQMESWRRTDGMKVPSGGILVSGTTLLDADSILRLADFLLSGGRFMQPLLVLGITEAVLGERSRAVEGLLRRIDGSGIRLLLDAFGAGNTALLWRWQCIDLVRLEMQAAGEEHMGRLARLAQQLDLTVLVHQVNRPRQLELLRRAGVNYAQGEAVAPLLEPGQVPGYLAAQARRRLEVPGDVSPVSRAPLFSPRLS